MIAPRANPHILSLFLVLQIFPQKYWERRFKDYTNPDELVTMAESLPFNQAVELLSKVSESMTGKRIVNATQISDPIGIEIVNMPYDKAMVIIVQYANLRFEEKEDIIVIKSKDVEDESCYLFTIQHGGPRRYVDNGSGC